MKKLFTLLMLSISFNMSSQTGNTNYGTNALSDISSGDYNAAFGYQSLENKLSDTEKINVGVKKDLDQTRNTKDEAVIKFAEHTDRLMIEEQKRQQKVIDDKESELSEKRCNGNNMRMMFKIIFN